MPTDSTLDKATLLNLIGYDPSKIPSDDDGGDLYFTAQEEIAKANGVDLPLSAAEWIAAMDRRLRVLRRTCEAINSWADDRPEDAAQMLSEMRRKMRLTEERRAHYQTQSDGLN